MAWRKSRYERNLQQKWKSSGIWRRRPGARTKREKQFGDLVQVYCRVPKSYRAKLEEVAAWEQRDRSAVILMMLNLGFEVYDAMVASLAGKMMMPKGLTAVPSSIVLVEAVGKARLVDQAATEVLKRNRAWLLEREAEERG